MTDLAFVTSPVPIEGAFRDTAEMSEIPLRVTVAADSSLIVAGDRSPWGPVGCIAMSGTRRREAGASGATLHYEPKDAYMAMPVLSANLDKASYVPGETAILTVVYNGGETTSNVITVTGTDQAGNAAQVTVVLSVVDKVGLAVVDDSGRVWALQSDDGSTAVFTATI